MICLNYHRVESGAHPDFYTLPPARLAQHLRSIREQGIRVVGVDEALSAQTDGGMVMMHFDDGTEDHASEVFPLLQADGAVGVFFVSTAKIGMPGYLSISQVKELAAAGHDIECHGHSHRRMDHMTPDELDRELASSIAFIREWTGRPPRILAPPGGYINRQVIASARRHSLGTLRTMRWNTNSIPLRGLLDCLVVTRTTPDNQVQRWLQGRGIGMLRASYFMKQTLRSMMPFHLYLKIRSHLFFRSDTK